MSSVGNRRCATAPPAPAMRDNSNRQAATPISYVGWATTVSAGLTTSTHSVSSKPSPALPAGNEPLLEQWRGTPQATAWRRTRGSPSDGPSAPTVWPSPPRRPRVGSRPTRSARAGSTPPPRPWRPGTRPREPDRRRRHPLDALHGRTEHPFQHLVGATGHDRDVAVAVGQQILGRGPAALRLSMPTVSARRPATFRSSRTTGMPAAMTLPRWAESGPSAGQTTSRRRAVRPSPGPPSPPCRPPRRCWPAAPRSPGPAPCRRCRAAAAPTGFSMSDMTTPVRVEPVIMLRARLFARYPSCSAAASTRSRVLPHRAIPTQCPGRGGGGHPCLARDVGDRRDAARLDVPAHDAPSESLWCHQSRSMPGVSAGGPLGGAQRAEGDPGAASDS